MSTMLATPIGLFGGAISTHTHFGNGGRLSRFEPRETSAGSGAGGHEGCENVVRVAIEILAGSVIPHRGARVGAAIWTSRKSTPASKLVVTRVICTRSREMPGQTPFTE